MRRMSVILKLINSSDLRFVNTYLNAPRATLLHNIIQENQNFQFYSTGTLSYLAFQRYNGLFHWFLTIS